MDWSYDVEHDGFMLIGSMIMAVGVGAWALAGWIFWRLARMRRRAPTAFVALPRRPLMESSPGWPGEQAQIHINGTILGEPSLTAPATGRPCSIWELALVEIIPADYDSNQGVNHLWVTSRCSDLTIECDARVVMRPGPPRGHPYEVIPGPLTVTVAGEQIEVHHRGGTDPGLSFFRGRRLPADVSVLEEAGAPGQLVSRVRASPSSFFVLEASIAPGELVSLFQQTSVPGQVDPSATAQLGVMGYQGDMAAQASSTIGCLTIVFAVAGIAAAAFGAMALIIGLLSIVS